MRAALSLVLLLLVMQAAGGAPIPGADTATSYRTDSANSNLPWYRLKPGEFPPHHSDHRVGGELVEADYIHRSGVFRMAGTGELVNFTLPPFGSVYYRNAEADLRDVPIGTYFLFFLYQDDKGAFTQVATMQDEYTMAANHGLSYRLDAAKLDEGKLLVTRHSVSKPEPEAPQQEILVDARTRVWKGGKPAKLTDLTAGDELLFNVTGGSGSTPRRCTEIWVGADSWKLATDQERTRHFAFLKARGIPAWIDAVDGDRLTVTLFSSEPASLQALFTAEGIDPAQWAREHRRVSVAVANEHLRTYLPNVTDKWATVQAFQTVPTDCYGCSGMRWVLEPELMLEGYRKGRVVRLFPQSWPIDAMPFGEGLYAGGHDEEPADSKELQPADFPYRTDFGNEDLPWYRLQPGKMPPDHSEHRIGGELVKVDSAHRTGRLRMDGAGNLVDFTLEPVGKVLYLNADARLEDLPLGMRCLFFLYQDEKGAFTRATVIEDEYSDLASSTVTYRLESADLKGGTLIVARHAAPVKVDYVLEPRVPTDFGRIALEVDARTRIWKGDRQVTLRDLAVGDELLINRAARTTTSRGRCTDIWAGAETHRLTTEQRKIHAAASKFEIQARTF